MPQNPYERWQPPARYYAELCDRARALDPKAVIAGAASSSEIARLEGVVEQLEKAAKAAKEKEANSTVGRASAELSGLYRRADEARGKVVSLQAELKARGSRELTILMTPADLEAPAPITQSASCNSIEEYQACIAATTSRATGLEAMGRRLSNYIVEWPRMSPEAQNRKLILALAERLK